MNLVDEHGAHEVAVLGRVFIGVIEMTNFFAKSLMAKLVGLFLLVSVVPAIVIGSLSFFTSKTILERTVFEKLSSAIEIRRLEINDYLESAAEDTLFLAQASSAIRIAERMKPPTNRGDSGAERKTDRDSQDYSKIQTEAAFFQSFLDHYSGDSHAYNDILVIGSPNGDVLYSTQKVKGIGSSVVRGPYKETPLARLFARVVQTGIPGMADFSFYPMSDTPLAFFGAPISDGKGNVLGMLALAIDSRRINRIMRSSADMGRLTMVYLVGSDFLMRSQLQSETTPTILKKRIEFKAVTLALRDESGTAIMPDEKGQISLISYASVGIKENRMLGADFSWAIIADAETYEALAPVTDLGIRIALIGALLALVTVLIGSLFARSVARPINRLSAQVFQASQGDLSIDVTETKRRDELGELINSFQVMLNNFREQTDQILTGVNVLASASTQISSTVSQLASSGSQTSSAVSQTTATLEQLRQTGRLSSDKAKSIAEDSRKSFQIAQAGKKATEDTIEGMTLIKGQMESIGETVIRLSEQSRSIEEIIAAVKDLAEQSNLLAVNAAIEAARAGEHGKGFTVVAEEIKSLSDQSKRATDQVRTILEDIRTSISGVVMATERGSKAVDAGATQSFEAGESIEEVTKSVHEASQALSVIVASSEQQSVGIDQVALAMDNIDRAMQQNVEGTRQLQQSARDLADLGGRLKDLVERYKI